MSKPHEPDLIEQLIAYSVWLEEARDEREEFRNKAKGVESKAIKRD